MLHEFCKFYAHMSLGLSLFGGAYKKKNFKTAKIIILIIHTCIVYIRLFTQNANWYHIALILC